MGPNVSRRGSSPRVVTPRIAAAGPGSARRRWLASCLGVHCPAGADYFTSSIFVAVISIFPATSLTVPVAVTWADFLQMLSWNSLLTSFWAR